MGREVGRDVGRKTRCGEEDERWEGREVGKEVGEVGEVVRKQREEREGAEERGIHMVASSLLYPSCPC